MLECFNSIFSSKYKWKTIGEEYIIRLYLKYCKLHLIGSYKSADFRFSSILSDCVKQKEVLCVFLFVCKSTLVNDKTCLKFKMMIVNFVSLWRQITHIWMPFMYSKLNKCVGSNITKSFTILYVLSLAKMFPSYRTKTFIPF